MSDFSLVPGWPAPGNVRCLITTREGGCSPAPFDGFNLATHVGDDARLVAKNREALTLRIGVQPVWLDQVHGINVVDLDAGQELPQAPEADASISRSPGKACAVLTADCLPVLLCDRAGTVVAAAHAGWRGLVAGVLEETIRRMNVRPGEILAWLGPAIGPQAFEVGNEVRAVFVASDAAAAGAFVATGVSGKWMADLFTLARQRLIRAGVGSVAGGGTCTFTDHRRFYSYRREGSTGRFASLIWLDDQPLGAGDQGRKVELPG